MGTLDGRAFLHRLVCAVAVIVICSALATLLVSCGGDPKRGSNRGDLAEKPVVYLYPEEECEAEVALSFDGELSCVYPAFAEAAPDGSSGVWRVVARPDSTVVDPASGREFGYLFWEGRAAWEPDMSRGFCVAGPDTGAFLEDALGRLGLSDREACDFVTYWLPRMQESPYNLVSFQGEAYAGAARLEVDPAPDAVIRVFMAWRPLEAPVEVEPQELSAPERAGFTVVEWGGAQVG